MDDKRKLRGIENMIIRKYQPSDCQEISELFYNTVHGINAKDYTSEQLNVWAMDEADLEKWNLPFKKNHTIVAIDNEVIVGFSDIDESGYLGRLYVHKDYQKQGIATAICTKLEDAVSGNIRTHAQCHQLKPNIYQ